MLKKYDDTKIKILHLGFEDVTVEDFTRQTTKVMSHSDFNLLYSIDNTQTDYKPQNKTNSVKAAESTHTASPLAGDYKPSLRAMEGMVNKAKLSHTRDRLKEAISIIKEAQKLVGFDGTELMTGIGKICDSIEIRAENCSGGVCYSHGEGLVHEGKGY